MLRTTLLTSALALSSTAAFAGGLETPIITPAPMAPVVMALVAASDWTGFYIGGSAGMITANIDDGADLDGSTYNLNAGYLQDLGSVVVGGELEYGKIDLDDLAGTDNADILRLKARVGYDAGAFLPYLTAGGASLTLNADDISSTGYFYGIGAEYALTDNFRVGGEVLQHEFDDFDDQGFDLSAQTVALRVSYSF